MRSLSGGLRHGRQGARGPSEGQSNHYHALSVKRTGTEGWKEGSVKGISQACLQFSSVMKPQPGNREQRGRARAIVEMCLALLRLNSLKKVKGGMPATLRTKINQKCAALSLLHSVSRDAAKVKSNYFSPLADDDDGGSILSLLSQRSQVSLVQQQRSHNTRPSIGLLMPSYSIGS